MLQNNNLIRVEQGNANNKITGIYSKVIRAGRSRTYFFDVRKTINEEYYLTITESKKRYDSDSYERHKVHVYKEDFNKFIDALQGIVDHVKTLMPQYDFDEFNRPVQTIEYDSEGNPIHEERPVQEEKKEDDEIISDDDLKW